MSAFFVLVLYVLVFLPIVSTILFAVLVCSFYYMYSVVLHVLLCTHIQFVLYYSMYRFVVATCSLLYLSACTFLKAEVMTFA